MQTTLALATILLSLQLIAQSPENILKGKASGVNIFQKKIDLSQDTTPQVIYLTEKKKHKDVLFFLNGQAFTEHGLEMLDPQDIEGITVKKDSMLVNGHMYTGQIYIDTKEEYQPKLISLNQLKEKYVKLDNESPTLFMLNDKLIETNYDTFKVDEKHILSIEVQSVNNSQEDININVIKLISKTEENIKKANTIRLKGESL